jgi:hypothetical protein
VRVRAVVGVDRFGLELFDFADPEVRRFASKSAPGPVAVAYVIADADRTFERVCLAHDSGWGPPE